LSYYIVLHCIDRVAPVVGVFNATIIILEVSTVNDIIISQTVRDRHIDRFNETLIEKSHMACKVALI